ncbi:hypothetical protein [Kitasatospora sp. NPDC088783]|uniref:hypothetical protein n=1 Tax=Kitasatospora sp. NPDC088783 TaxID=3364077 RepID=UPI003825E00C
MSEERRSASSKNAVNWNPWALVGGDFVFRDAVTALSLRAGLTGDIGPHFGRGVGRGEDGSRQDQPDHGPHDRKPHVFSSV